MIFKSLNHKKQFKIIETIELKDVAYRTLKWYRK